MTPKSNPTNPFIYGPPVPPEKFIGREREVDIILDRLANPNNRGGSTVNGPSGIGKTSLLHYLCAEDTRKHWAGLHPDITHFVYMPLDLIFPFSEIGFWEYLFGELGDWLGSTAGLQKIVVALEAGKLPSRFNITRFLSKLGSSEKKLVVVLLDGFDLLVGEITQDNSEARLGFLHTLRALLNLPAPRGFSLVTSSERELYDLFENVPWFGSAFYNNMANLPLGPFDQAQIDALIDSYLGGTGIQFDSKDREYLNQVSAGHPKKLQQAAHALFEEKTSPNDEGEKEMTASGPEQFAMMVLSQSVGFLFDEARKILAERRQRRQDMSQKDDTVALPAGVEESTKEAILELRPVNFNEEAQKEVNHLLELISIHQNHRRNAELTIASVGGILNATPRERAQLENAEDEILKRTKMLKELLEKVYDQPIHIDGLE